ncbi:MAG: glutamate--cysteine ligase [Bacteriovoracaceae bacterium]
MIIEENLLWLVEENADYLLELHQGIEKEGLRVLDNGSISLRPHPAALGHKLSHPYVTTDYAENLLEFVTPVFTDNEGLLNFLKDIQTYALNVLEKDESVWPASMPSLLPEEKDIPVAYFGESNTGKLKTLYREGLSHRYGKAMQSIAGMHYNFSLSRKFVEKLPKQMNLNVDPRKFTDDIYFKLIRNFRRYSWLVSYLFGASPAVDESFLKGKEHTLQKLGKNTYGREFATSLRMGGLGYTSAAQNEIAVCYNQLPTYISTLEKARKRPYPPYEKLGVKVDGEYRQLNSNLLQIDNEFYSTLRPKRTARSGESALQALHQHGVEYIEVRLLDLNPFEACGISEEDMRFLQLFLTFCLIEESRAVSDAECDQILQNFETVVNEGRNPKARLRRGESSLSVKNFSLELLEKMEALLDAHPKLKSYYESSLKAQLEKINKPEKLLAARVLEGIGPDVSFVDSTFSLAQKHKKELLGRQLGGELRQTLDALAQSSLRQERELSKSDREDFDVFLKKYFDKIKIEEY